MPAFAKKERLYLFAVLALAAAFWSGVFWWNLPKEPVVSARVQDLWRAREVYLGRRVKTSGQVKVFLEGEPKEHWALESDDAFRVGLSGLKPAKLRGLRGEWVEAEGFFRFEENRGGFLENPRLSPLSRR